MALPGWTEEFGAPIHRRPAQLVQPGQPRSARGLTAIRSWRMPAGNTYTVKSPLPRLANGASTVLDASIRLGRK